MAGQKTSYNVIRMANMVEGEGVIQALLYIVFMACALTVDLKRQVE